MSSNSEVLAELYALQSQTDDLESRIESLVSENADLAKQLKNEEERWSIKDKHQCERMQKLENDLKDQKEKGKQHLKKIRELELAARISACKTSVPAIKIEEVTPNAVTAESSCAPASSVVPVQTQHSETVVIQVAKESSFPASPLTSLSPVVPPHAELETHSHSVPINTKTTTEGVTPELALNSPPTVTIPLSSAVIANIGDDDSVPVSYSRGSSLDHYEVLGNGHEDQEGIDVLQSPGPEAQKTAPVAEVSPPVAKLLTESFAKANEGGQEVLTVPREKEKAEGDSDSDDSESVDLSSGTPLNFPHTGASVPVSTVQVRGVEHVTGTEREKVWPKKHAGRKTNLQYVREKLLMEKQQQQQLQQLQQQHVMPTKQKDDSDQSGAAVNFRKRHRESDGEEEEEQEEAGVKASSGESADKKPRVTPHSEKTVQKLDPFAKYKAAFSQPLDQSTDFSTILRQYANGANDADDDPFAHVAAGVYFNPLRGTNSISAYVPTPPPPPPPLTAGVTRTFSSNDSLGSGGSSFNAYGRKKVVFSEEGKEQHESESTAGTSSKARSRVTDPYEEVLLQTVVDDGEPDSDDDGSNAFRKKGKKDRKKKITLI